MKNEVLKSKSRQLNWCVSNFQSDDISPYKKMKYFLGIFKESRERSLRQTMITKITKKLALKSDGFDPPAPQKIIWSQT